VQALKQILDYLAHPIASAKLADVYAVWMRDYRADPDVDAGVESTIKTLKAIRKVEDYIAPYAVDWLENNLQDDEQTELRDHLAEFRDVVGQWTRAADLPIDQLILTISGDIFTDVGDIATAYMVASMLRRESDIYPDMRLLEFIEILQEIYAGKRKFSGIGDDDRGFNPDAHKGKVTVTTMHKAKGLEWDRVYLMSVNNYDFPSIDPHDTYIGESWYTRDGLNLSEECLAQLRVLQTGDTYKEGDATSAARVEYVSERLRLLYVGITRARKDLVISWNTGRRQENTEATPLIALRTFWERERNK
jgi:DNA helicase-2/ATP-dependent DNA helicase PcrA